MRMHKVGPLGSQQSHQVTERPYVRQRRKPSCERDRDNAESFAPRPIEQRALCAYPDHFMPASSNPAHQRQQEMP
jgi:hypothetical protein